MAFDKRRAKAGFAALREAVSQALREADPIGLIRGGAPRNEYDPEVGTILPRLRGVTSAEDIQSIVHEEFVSWFGEETAGSFDDYQRAAQSIWAIVRDNEAVKQAASAGGVQRHGQAKRPRRRG